MLTRWLNEDAAHPLLVLRALGGFGKSALTWHWLMHDVDAQRRGRASSGGASTKATPASITSSWKRWRISTVRRPRRSRSPRAKRSWRLLQALHQPGTLLVLDGFERVLRAFGGLEAAYQGDEAKHTDHDRDCISPLAETFLYNVALQPQLQLEGAAHHPALPAHRSRPRAAVIAVRLPRRATLANAARGCCGVLPRPGHPRHAHRDRGSLRALRLSSAQPAPARRPRSSAISSSPATSPPRGGWT